jgi:predicted TIM-barrel fold metal-dependent hydrolase
VPKAIHVQAAVNTPDPVVETEWLQAFADRTGYPHGIVAECHLARPDAATVLDRHLKFANVRGIRNFGEGRYLVDPAWRRGFAELAPRRLVSCIDTRVELADDILDLALSFPETELCIDHCAIPMGRDADSFKRWRAAMDVMARSPNVTMKISGLGMGDPLWTVSSIRPYVLGSIEAFGTGRVVFGTNWPVDRMFSSYPDVIDAYAEIISGFSRDEQTAMFSGNAERLFRI